jgi:preprotein translocase subunit YajC
MFSILKEVRYEEWFLIIVLFSIVAFAIYFEWQRPDNKKHKINQKELSQAIYE